jgi:hypothetical protein
MLKTIRQFDKKTREGILSDIALELGRPSVGERHSLEYLLLEAKNKNEKSSPVFEVLQGIWNHPNDARLMALGEIYKQLGLNVAEYSNEYQARILRYIGHEIRTLSLDTGRIAAVRKRLGQKGVLAPNAYNIKFAKEFKDVCESFGFTENEMRQGIAAPDMVQHFIPEVQDNTEAISLYVKTIPNGKDPYSLLIDTLRKGDEVIVHFALRVYHSDVEVSGISNPTELLKAFTDKFGADISINGEKGKLILYKKINAGESEIKVEYGVNSIVRLSQRKMSNGEAEVSISYGVNTKEYVNSLISHGVKARMPELRTN